MGLIWSRWAQQWPAVVGRALEAPRGLVIFDMDGTLLDGDVGELLFLDRLAEGVRPPGLVDLLGPDLLASYRRYQAEGPDPVHYAACSLALAGLDRAALLDRVEGLVRAGRIALRPSMAALARAFRAAGHEVVVVTGSSAALAEVALGRLGLELPVVGQRLEEVDGCLQDRVVEPIVCGEGKIEALAAVDRRRPLFMAGDSRGDFALMDTALVGALVVPPGPGAVAEGAAARGFSVLLPDQLPPPPGAAAG